MECVGKGKARQPYGFDVKASVAVSDAEGLMVGSRTFPGNPDDGHLLHAQLEQAANLLEHVDVVPRQVLVDLGFRGVDADDPDVDLIHRGTYRTLSDSHRR